MIKKFGNYSLNEEWIDEYSGVNDKKLKIVQKLEEIELFVYDNPKPKPSDIRNLCNELVSLCLD